MLNRMLTEPLLNSANHPELVLAPESKNDTPSILKFIFTSDNPLFYLSCIMSFLDKEIMNLQCSSPELNASIKTMFNSEEKNQPAKLTDLRFQCRFNKLAYAWRKVVPYSMNLNRKKLLSVANNLVGLAPLSFNDRIEIKESDLMLEAKEEFLRQTSKFIDSAMDAVDNRLHQIQTEVKTNIRNFSQGFITCFFLTGMCATGGLLGANMWCGLKMSCEASWSLCGGFITTISGAHISAAAPDSCCTLPCIVQARLDKIDNSVAIMLDLSGKKAQSIISDELRSLVRKHPPLRSEAYKSLRSTLFFLTAEESRSKELALLEQKQLVTNQLKNVSR